MSNDTVHMYRDAAGEWRWRRVAANGNIVSESGEGYARRTDCEEMARQVNPGVTVVVDAPE